MDWTTCLCELRCGGNGKAPLAQTDKDQHGHQESFRAAASLDASEAAGADIDLMYRASLAREQNFGSLIWDTERHGILKENINTTILLVPLLANTVRFVTGVAAF